METLITREEAELFLSKYDQDIDEDDPLDYIIEMLIKLKDVKTFLAEEQQTNLDTRKSKVDSDSEEHSSSNEGGYRNGWKVKGKKKKTSSSSSSSSSSSDSWEMKKNEKKEEKNQ